MSSRTLTIKFRDCAKAHTSQTIIMTDELNALSGLQLLCATATLLDHCTRHFGMSKVDLCAFLATRDPRVHKEVDDYADY